MFLPVLLCPYGNLSERQPSSQSHTYVFPFIFRGPWAFILQIKQKLYPMGILNLSAKDNLCGGLTQKPASESPATIAVGHSAGLDPASAAQVCERPLMFLLDTPGVLAPRIESVETGLKLALCGKPLAHC